MSFEKTEIGPCTLDGGPAPDLAGMGDAQKMMLLEQVIDALTQRLCTEFGVDAKTMALTLSGVQNKWVMSIATNVCLR